VMLLGELLYFTYVLDYRFTIQAICSASLISPPLTACEPGVIAFSLLIPPSAAISQNPSHSNCASGFFVFIRG